MFRLYSHGGSGNHGCEALVRSTAKILKNSGFTTEDVTLYSYSHIEDMKYIDSGIFADIVSIKQPERDWKYYLHALLYKAGWTNSITHIRHQSLFEDIHEGDICLCMGGDTYTYDGWPEVLAYVNRQLKRRGAKIVLWGCSISEELVKDTAFLDDMRSFDLITVREPISYKLFADAGITDNIVLVSDPAFELDITDYDIKQLFDNHQPVIGLNLSPLVIDCAADNAIVLNNYQALVKHILDNTSYNILFVPHVVWQGNDDREAIHLIYEQFQNDRIAVLQDMNASRLKGAIRHCELFIGARTHATIAAYSQNVPTLVVGYSVKAKGIAESLFETYDKYVLPVQSLKTPTDLVSAFQFLEENKGYIRETLSQKMPAYRQHCYDAIPRLKELINT